MGSHTTGSNPRLPDRLGAYQLFRRIGRGGMAEVYVARKDGDLMDRELVVKRMLPHLADDERFVRMFLREARIAMRLTHPNVVQMFEVGVDGEEHFIAMELLEGLSAYHLARRVWQADASLPLSLVARIIADAALGLHYAHTLRGDDGNPARLVHRDVSADNIFVTSTGITKLLDFGIAAGAFAGRVTRTGEIKGKVRYMSPEQLLGEELDARADIFALGVTLYWLLAGRYPFTGKTELVTMKAVLETEPPPPSSGNPEVPPELDALVAHMMNKVRADRMASADLVYEALLPFTRSVAGQNDAAAFMTSALLLQPARMRSDDEETSLAVPATARSGSSSTILPHPPVGGASPNDAEWPEPSAEATGATAATPAERTLEGDCTDERGLKSPASTVNAGGAVNSTTIGPLPSGQDSAGAEFMARAPAPPAARAIVDAIPRRRPRPAEPSLTERAAVPLAPRRTRGMLVWAAVGVVLAGAAVAVALDVSARLRGGSGDEAVARGRNLAAAVDAGAGGAVVVDTGAIVVAPALDAGPPSAAVAAVVDAGVVVRRAAVDAGAAGAALVSADAGAGTIASAEPPTDAGAIASAGPPADAGADEDAERPDAGASAVDERPDDPPITARASRRITVRGPPHVEWRAVGGELLGRGARTLALPRGAKKIVAVDTQLRGRVTLPVADVIDWGALPKGELAFVVVPFADVTVGTQRVGRTPGVVPLSLVAATYEVTLQFEDKKKVVKAVVAPGKRFTVKANMQLP